MPTAADFQRPRADQYQPLVLILASLVLGMVVDRYISPLSAGVWWACSAVALGGWFIGWQTRREKLSNGLLLLSLAALAASWHHDRWQLFSSVEIGRAAREDTKPIVLEGIALTSPRYVPAPPFSALRSIPKGDQTELLVRVVSVRNGQTWQAGEGIAAVDVEGHVLGVRAGDRLRIYALMTRLPAPLNPGEFDFAAHQRSRRILCRLRSLFPEHIEQVSPGSFWNWRRWLATVRDQGNWQLHRFIGGSRAALAAAILIGSREQLNPEQNEGFLVTGTIHILM